MGKKDYSDYLNDLKNRIYKILPLCEERDPNILKYIQSTLFEIRGLFPIIPETKSAIWYVRAISVLNTMANNYSIEQLHNPEIHSVVIKREVFNLLNLIDREMNQL